MLRESLVWGCIALLVSSCGTGTDEDDAEGDGGDGPGGVGGTGRAGQSAGGDGNGGTAGSMGGSANQGGSADAAGSAGSPEAGRGTGARAGSGGALSGSAGTTAGEAGATEGGAAGAGNDGAAGNSGNAGGSGAAGAGGGCTSEVGDFCTTLPRFSASAQVVDGIPDEFCDAEPRVSGARFGFDLMVGVCDEYLGIPELEGALHYNELPEETMCPFGGTPTLGCDDRTWCLPALE